MFGSPNDIQVAPDGSNWRVINGIESVSKHNTKSAAKNKAKRIASDGDNLTIRKSDGTIQTKKKV